MNRKDEILTNFAGNEELLKVCKEQLINTYEVHLQGIKKAIEENDLYQLQYHAHTLKGKIRYFKEEPLMKLFQEIEEAQSVEDPIIQKNLEEAKTLLPNFIEAVKNL